MLPDDDSSKVNACVDEVYRFWYDTKEDKLTQLLFCDLSTPKKDGSFSVYNDVRDKLVTKGVPEKEIQFIHDANTEVRKKELFAKDVYKRQVHHKVIQLLNLKRMLIRYC